VSSGDKAKSKSASSQGWELVQRRRPVKYLTGSRSTASEALQGLQQTINLYVGRYANSVENYDIFDYIKTEFDISFIKCARISNEESHSKWFKVTVLSFQINNLLKPDKEPEHVRDRKYFNRVHNSNSRRDH